MPVAFSFIEHSNSFSFGIHVNHGLNHETYYNFPIQDFILLVQDRLGVNYFEK